jgi:thiol-disulfide isomerase/thioredoxin
MKTTGLIVFLILTYSISFCQDTPSAAGLLARVMKAQAVLKNLEYSVVRRDTLVTGDIRLMSGRAAMEVDEADTLTGFKFRAKKDNEAGEKVYSRYVGYETNPGKKTYRMITGTAALKNMLLGGGGHLVMPDLVKIDTAQSRDMKVQEDAGHYILTILYPDLREYDVTNRKKIITIDKTNMLPVAVRHHQETYGKIQDLYFKITDLIINTAAPYPFSEPPFLKEYTYQSPEPVKRITPSLQGKAAPYFSLESFDEKTIGSGDLKGKVILLDFWEVWCDPCIESMPKVIALRNRYRDRGLEVYGITNDLKQLSSARAFVKQKKISFPMLIGNGQLKKDYQLGAVPMYVLIDRKGIVRLVSAGYPLEMEKIIEETLE